MELTQAISALVAFWKGQGIPIEGAAESALRNWERQHQVTLPADFVALYQVANGWHSYYPNYSDQEGYVWYPIEEVVPMEAEMESRWKGPPSNTFLFADYLTRCWFYGLRISDQGTYEIGILPSLPEFTPITDSLPHFIALYMADANEMYPP